MKEKAIELMILFVVSWIVIKLEMRKFPPEE